MIPPLGTFPKIHPFWRRRPSLIPKQPSQVTLVDPRRQTFNFSTTFKCSSTEISLLEFSFDPQLPLARSSHGRSPNYMGAKQSNKKYFYHIQPSYQNQHNPFHIFKIFLLGFPRPTIPPVRPCQDSLPNSLGQRI